MFVCHCLSVYSTFSSIRLFIFETIFLLYLLGRMLRNIFTLAGAKVWWLWEKTHVLKVMGSNPRTIYWMDIFTYICFKKCNVCWERWKQTKKILGLAHFYKKNYFPFTNVTSFMLLMKGSVNPPTFSFFFFISFLHNPNKHSLWSIIMCNVFSVTRKKSPNVYKSCPKMFSLEKWKVLTPLQIA